MAIPPRPADTDIRIGNFTTQYDLLPENYSSWDPISFATAKPPNPYTETATTGGPSGMTSAAGNAATTPTVVYGAPTLGVTGGIPMGFEIPKGLMEQNTLRVNTGTVGGAPAGGTVTWRASGYGGAGSGDEDRKAAYQRVYSANPNHTHAQAETIAANIERIQSGAADPFWGNDPFIQSAMMGDVPLTAQGFTTYGEMQQPQAQPQSAIPQSVYQEPMAPAAPTPDPVPPVMKPNMPRRFDFDSPYEWRMALNDWFAMYG